MLIHYLSLFPGQLKTLHTCRHDKLLTLKIVHVQMYQEEPLKYKTGDSLINSIINSLIHVLVHPHNAQSSSFCNHGNHDLIINSFFGHQYTPKIIRI